MAVSLASLLVRTGKTAIYDFAIGIARAVGLPVTSWQPGDPTRSLYYLEAELLDRLEELILGFISSGFLDYATGVWLKVLAEQVYGVVVPEATYATTDVVLTNNGGGVYTEEDLAPGQITFKSSVTGKTYRNTTGPHEGGPLGSGPGTTVTLTVVADEPGSESSAGAGELDELVTNLIEVTCTNPTAAVGLDEQSEETTRQQCRDKLGALSPNGPKDAYAYVARNAELTGTRAVTRVRVYSDSETGDVDVYLAGPSGGVSGGDRTLVEAAIVARATPLCITPSVFSAPNVTVNVTYTLWIYKSCNKTSDEVKADIEDALEAMFAVRPIGGDIIPPATTGALYKSMIESTIRGVFSQAFRVTVSAPSGDTALAKGEVAKLGTVTGTVNIVVDP